MEISLSPKEQVKVKIGPLEVTVGENHTAAGAWLKINNLIMAAYIQHNTPTVSLHLDEKVSLLIVDGNIQLQLGEKTLTLDQLHGLLKSGVD